MKLPSSFFFILTPKSSHPAPASLWQPLIFIFWNVHHVFRRRPQAVIKFTHYHISVTEYHGAGLRRSRSLGAMFLGEYRLGVLIRSQADFAHLPTFRIVKSFWRGHRIKRRLKGHSFRANVLSQGHGFLRQSPISLDEKWYGAAAPRASCAQWIRSHLNITRAHSCTCHPCLALIGYAPFPSLLGWTRNAEVTFFLLLLLLYVSSGCS